MDTLLLSPSDGHRAGIEAPVVIHDFVRVDLPFDAVVAAFAHSVGPDLLSALVDRAWTEEVAEITRRDALRIEPLSHDHAIDAWIGPYRSRLDTVIVPISWRSSRDTWMPPLDADLEIVGFGTDRTHLHVLGRSSLPPCAVPFTERASLNHRLAVALVRHVLCDLATQLVTDAAG
ncbi:MAG: hypothetical protein AAF467_01475 [Actinomycetota bacterium]